MTTLNARTVQADSELGAKIKAASQKLVDDLDDDVNVAITSMITVLSIIFANKAESEADIVDHASTIADSIRQQGLRVWRMNHGTIN